MKQQEKPSQKSGIYTIENLVNGKLYVGYATSFRSRWSKHLWELERNNHANKHLQNAWNKYGDNNIWFEVLVECEIDQLTSEEHYWATLLNVHDRRYGYNIDPTNPHNPKPVRSKETLRKMSLANMGKKMSAEWCQKQSERLKGKPSPFKGKTHTEESKEKWRKSNEEKGWYKRTEEQIESARKKMTGRTKPREEYMWRFRPVCQYTLDGQLIAEYESVQQARKAVGAVSGEISVVCKYYDGTYTEGKRSNRRTCKGYIWKYKEDKI